MSILRTFPSEQLVPQVLLLQVVVGGPGRQVERVCDGEDAIADRGVCSDSVLTNRRYSSTSLERLLLRCLANALAAG